MDVKADNGNALKRFLAAFREAPKEVLWRGYRETPKRLQQRWLLIFYVIPALFFPVSVHFFLNAITPVPLLSKADVYQGVASIYRHPSRGIGTVFLRLEDGNEVSFSCRHGMSSGPHCLPPEVLQNYKQYEGKSARVWASPRVGAIQIEINGQVVLTYEQALHSIDGGGFLGSNETGIFIFLTFLTYWLWVAIGFPYLNYQHWKARR